MNLSLFFARRYLKSKKSTQAINVITSISVVGIALGTMALIVILSVFNGFEDLLEKMMGSFKPDLYISPKTGKTIEINKKDILQIESIAGVISVAPIIEEVALFEHEGIQNIGLIKGVDVHFLDVIPLDSSLNRGNYFSFGNYTNKAFVGATLEHTLQIRTLNAKPIKIYLPKRKMKLSITSSQPFNQFEVIPSATYTVRQVDFDNTLIVHLKIVKDLLQLKDNQYSALVVKLDPDKSESASLAIKKILKGNFQVKNRYQQDEDFYKITNMEKWIGFLIFSLTLVMVAFNMLAALWMLVLDKKRDISHLKAMGAPNQLIRNIFLYEGFLLSAIGMSIGFILAIVLILLQQHYGLIQLDNSGGSFIINAYPVSMRLFDFIVVIITVFIIGALASLLPAYRAVQISSISRDA